MEFLSDLAVVLGIAGVLGILSATLYIAIEVRAATLTAEKAEDHLNAIRRDIRLLAGLTMKARAEASSGRGKVLEQLRALKPPPAPAPKHDPGLPRLSPRSEGNRAKLGPKPAGPRGGKKSKKKKKNGKKREQEG